jgi:curved DNA-binding protein
MSKAAPSVGDHYSVLGVARDAEPQSIKRAFRKLARAHHPDVAGDDPQAGRRFNQIREAYEVLSDPGARARYDRRFQPRRVVHGKHIRMPGGFTFSGGASPKGGMMNAGVSMDLNDIFGAAQQASGRRTDFGFGKAAPQSSAPVRPQNGQDISMAVDVPAGIARKGGTVTLEYTRMRPTEDRSRLEPYREIHDLRVPPGTRGGSTLRAHHMGHHGPGGGPPGDLVCDVRVTAPSPSQAVPSGQQAAATIVPISFAEAVLGGRVHVSAPAGEVRITVPAGTQSGTRMRLKGMGVGGADLIVELHVHVPTDVDAATRRLVNELAALHPLDPRQGGTD